MSTGTAECCRRARVSEFCFISLSPEHAFCQSCWKAVSFDGGRALAVRGYRVVPVNNADTGLELAQRIKIDAAFCSLHAPGLNWVELSERMQARVTGFVLLSDGYDAELAANFEGYNRYVLAKPVQESELDRVLRDLEPSLPLIKHGAA